MVLYLNDLIFTCPYCSIHFASQCQIRGTIIAQYFAQCFYNLKLNDLYIFNFATADKITPNFQFETNNLGFFRHWWKHPRGENNTSRLAYLYRVQIQCCVEGLRFTKILKLNKEKDEKCQNFPVLWQWLDPDPEPHWLKLQDPDPHGDQCGSETLLLIFIRLRETRIRILIMAELTLKGRRVGMTRRGRQVKPITSRMSGMRYGCRSPAPAHPSINIIILL